MCVSGLRSTGALEHCNFTVTPQPLKVRAFCNIGKASLACLRRRDERTGPAAARDSEPDFPPLADKAHHIGEASHRQQFFEATAAPHGTRRQEWRPTMEWKSLWLLSMESMEVGRIAGSTVIPDLRFGDNQCRTTCNSESWTECSSGLNDSRPALQTALNHTRKAENRVFGLRISKLRTSKLASSTRRA